MLERTPAAASSESAAGLLAVAAAASLWAIGATAAKALFERGVPPIELAEARSIIAVAGFAVVALLRRPARVRTRPLRLAALGLSIALVNAAYYLAIDHIPVAVALVIQYTAPAMVVAWTAVAARRAPSAPTLIALTLAVAGIVLVSELAAGNIGSVDAFGVAMALASAVLFAAYTLLSEGASRIYGATGAMLRAFAVSSIFWLIFQSFRGIPRALFEPANLWLIAVVGVVGTLLPFLLFVWGVSRLRAERAAIVATLEPVAGGIVAFLWLGQTLSAMQIGGGVLVIAAVIALQTTTRRAAVVPEY